MAENNYLPKIISALSKRGIGLNKPAITSDIETLKNKYDFVVSPFLQSIYLSFNGFNTPDQKSMLNVWSIDNILKRSVEFDELLPGGSFLIPMGDFLIDFDLLAIDPREDAGSIKLVFENRVLARGMKEFLSDLVEGKFDLY